MEGGCDLLVRMIFSRESVFVYMGNRVDFGVHLMLTCWLSAKLKEKKLVDGPRERTV